MSSYKDSFKTIILRAILKLVRMLDYLQRPFRSLLLVVGIIISPIKNFFWRQFIIRTYGYYLSLKKTFQKKITETGWWQLLRLKQTVLYLITILALIIGIYNLTNRSLAMAELPGQNNLIYPLIDNEFDNPFNDTGDLLNTPTDNTVVDQATTKYLAQDQATLLKPTFISTEPSTAQRQGIETYLVQSGDTISKIAEKFDLNINTILWENGLTLRSYLRIGQKISILPINGITYTIKRGDTLAKIAKQYKINDASISEFNGLDNKLVVGKKIILPDAKPLAAVVYRPPAQVTTNLPSSQFTAPVETGTKYLWPTAARRITQYFGWRHTGLDIAGPIGTPIYAAEDGVVIKSGWNSGGYGYYIIIDHGGGMATLYGHNSKLLVKAGEHVTRGQNISLMGSTGRSTGPHLHFEVRINGRVTNPLIYIR